MIHFINLEQLIDDYLQDTELLPLSMDTQERTHPAPTFRLTLASSFTRTHLQNCTLHPITLDDELAPLLAALNAHNNRSLHPFLFSRSDKGRPRIELNPLLPLFQLAQTFIPEPVDRALHPAAITIEEETIAQFKQLDHYGTLAHMLSYLPGLHLTPEDSWHTLNHLNRANFITGVTHDDQSVPFTGPGCFFSFERDSSFTRQHKLNRNQTIQFTPAEVIIGYILYSALRLQNALRHYAQANHPTIDPARIILVFTPGETHLPIIDAGVSYRGQNIILHTHPNHNTHTPAFRLPGYAIKELIGTGAWKQTRRAIKGAIGEVALKTLHIPTLLAQPNVQAFLKRRMGENTNLESYLIEQFTKEAQALLTATRARSRHIPTIYDADYDNKTKTFYIAEELGESTLAQLLHEHPILQPEDAMDVLAQLITALTDIHRLNIIHGDIKPENILFFGNILRFTDFGLASQLGTISASTTDGNHIAYLPCTAPEVLAGMHPTPESDYWAIGAITYRMLTGTWPFPHPYTGTTEDWRKLSLDERQQYETRMAEQITPERIATIHEELLRIEQHIAAEFQAFIDTEKQQILHIDYLPPVSSVVQEYAPLKETVRRTLIIAPEKRSITPVDRRPGGRYEDSWKTHFGGFLLTLRDYRQTFKNTPPSNQA